MERKLIIVNPGTGAVEGCSEENAVINMQKFIEDSPVEGLAFERIPSEDYGEGRYAFAVKRKGFSDIEVQMPGMPLEEVRWMGHGKGPSLMVCPRLYVNGSSYWWLYALIDEETYKKFD